MMNPRFFCPDGLLPDSDMALPAAVAHHAERVLRLAVGEAVTLFDGRGGECAATLLALGRQPLARLGPRLEVEREAPLAVTLVQALASGDKMDWIVQKAVELGAVAVQPVAAERSVLKLAGERAGKRVAHWQGVVASACEQCGRNQVPVIHPAVTLAQWLAAHPQPPHESRAVLSLAAGSRPLLQAVPAGAGSVVVLSGPEGGLSPQEEAAALAAGFAPITLGPRVLRAETAPLAALALLDQG